MQTPRYLPRSASIHFAPYAMTVLLEFYCLVSPSAPATAQATYTTGDITWERTDPNTGAFYDYKTSDGYEIVNGQLGVDRITQSGESARDDLEAGSVLQQAQFGDLHTQATGSLMPNSYSFSAYSTAEFTDTLTVTSSTLSDNGSGSFVFQLIPSGNLIAANPSALAGVSSFLSVRDSTGKSYKQEFLNQSSFPDGGGAYWTAPVELLGAIGDTFTIQGFAESYIDGSGGPSGSGALSDYFNTTHFYVDSLTAGVTLTSASGHNYASPAATPEPSSLALLGVGSLGLWGLGVKARKRKAGQIDA